MRSRVRPRYDRRGRRAGPPRRRVHRGADARPTRRKPARTALNGGGRLPPPILTSSGTHVGVQTNEGTAFGCTNAHDVYPGRSDAAIFTSGRRMTSGTGITGPGEIVASLCRGAHRRRRPSRRNPSSRMDFQGGPLLLRKRGLNLRELLVLRRHVKRFRSSWRPRKRLGGSQ